MADPQFHARDTIAALATPPGRGGVGIVRVSGPLAPRIAERLLGLCPPPRQARYLPFTDGDGNVVDQGIALYFAAPNSFTGEHVLELQGHGGPVVLDILLQGALRAGARPAEPGEFSRQAFLNDKLDLAQAEAVADLIDAASIQAARSALRSLQGEFSRRIHRLVEGLTELRIYVEAAIDFPEEEIDFLADGEVGRRLAAIVEEYRAIRATAQQGRLLREGMTVVLAGQPNAGKSSLLNALAGQQSAIVTEIPGTTRDLLREQIAIDGMPLHVIDTAGLRDSSDPVEQEGIRRAWTAIEQADRLLLLADDRDGFTAAEQSILERLPGQLAVTVLFNKIDLSGGEAGARPDCHGYRALGISARGGAGLAELRDHLTGEMGFHAGGEGQFMARRRHLEALERTGQYLRTAGRQLDSGRGELLAEELRLAQQELGTITGEVSADDLLGRIFSSFCIGK